MYDLLVITIVFLLLIINIKLSNNKKVIPATSDDWLIRFYVDKERKYMFINFYPVIAFHANKDKSKIITLWRIENDINIKKNNTEIYVFYRWARGNVLYEENGYPDISSFYGVVNWALCEKMLIMYDIIPEKYAKILQRAKIEFKTM